MCRNIRTLHNFEPPATRDEVHAAAVQYVRKISGTTKPSQANQHAFDHAVADVEAATRRLLESLTTTPRRRTARSRPPRRGPGPRCATRVADAALDLLGGRTVVLTGAGLSTDSGIPDYRGPGAPVRMPMTFQDFVAQPREPAAATGPAHTSAGRGWATAEPNDGHRALARLEALGRVHFLITQNVDGLHERAGQQQLVALHGRISEVVCLDCGGDARTGRRCSASSTMANPGWLEEHGAVTARPDGDVELEETSRFVVPACTGCGGRLKPHVVFFGENVPKERVAALLRRDRRGRRAARRGLVAHGDERPALRAVRRQGRPAGRDRQPRRHPRRRPRDRQGRGGLQRVALGWRWSSSGEPTETSGQRDEDVLGGLGDDLRSLA